MALRTRVAAYLSHPAGRERLTIFQWRADPGKRLTLDELMVESMREWPDSFRQGQEASEQAWCEIIRQPDAWTDMAFLLGCVDLFSVRCVLTSVNDLGEVRPMLSLEPRAGLQPKALIEIGCWLNRHFVAIAAVSSLMGRRRMDCECRSWLVRRTESPVKCRNGDPSIGLFARHRSSAGCWNADSSGQRCWWQLSSRERSARQ